MLFYILQKVLKSFICFKDVTIENNMMSFLILPQIFSWLHCWWYENKMVPFWACTLLFFLFHENLSVASCVMSWSRQRHNNAMKILYLQNKERRMEMDMPLLWTFSESCRSHELFDISMRCSQENKSVVMEYKIKPPITLKLRAQTFFMWWIFLWQTTRYNFKLL